MLMREKPTFWLCFKYKFLMKFQHIFRSSNFKNPWNWNTVHLEIFVGVFFSPFLSNNYIGWLLSVNYWDWVDWNIRIDCARDFIQGHSNKENKTNHNWMIYYYFCSTIIFDIFQSFGRYVYFGKKVYCMHLYDESHGHK